MKQGRTASSRWLAVTLLLLQWALLLNAATRLSATIDEPFHITSGYEYLRTGNVQLFDEHPPLAKALFAWPLFFVPDLAPPETASGYADGALITVAQETLLAYRPLDRVIVAPRIAAALLTVLLAATIYRVAATLAGPPAGALALALCALDPNFLAHGSLATTDMGATAFSLWALWAGTRWLQRPTRRRWGIAALLLGLAQGVKLTALLLYPVLGVGVVINAAAQRRQGAAFPWKTVGRFVAMAAVSALTLWALYGFELRPVAELLGGIPLPAASHIERWLRLQENLAYGREAFLLGQNSMHGWWTYFPVAFALKTPLPLLLLGLYTLFRRFFHAPARPFPLALLPLLLFPALYVLSSLTSTLNIGYRHLLPALPFVYIGIGVASARSHTDRDIKSHGTPDASPLTHDPLRIPLYALLAWLALGTLRLAPNYLTFFNEIAGGPENGWRFLADSNTDWGQAYKALAEFQQARGIETLQVAGFVFYDPAAYGVHYTPLTPLGGTTPAVFPARFTPPPGEYAISVTALDGVPLADPEMYDWFRRRQPDARIANAFFYYHVPQTEQPQWIAQCQIPVTPLSDEALAAGLESLPARRFSFDCTQAWVIPATGPGIYILHGTHTRDTLATRLLLQTPAPRDDFIARRLETATLSYRQRRTQATPPFNLYDAGTGDTGNAPSHTDGWIA
ncbi:MAG TPA: glycosyltransferase family 39 protein, partial [Anaerolineae bacterium]|nr:glycosyltransferase family 39 protein [Anaerolineae bacterium]